LTALLSAGHAARAADARTETAREHSGQGDAYYKLEKYGNAIGEYEQAYLAKPDPSFLYNIAQCHRLMGHSAEAIKFYRRFLKDAPNAPNRAVAEKHIRDLEETPAHPESPAETPTSSRPQTFPTPPAPEPAVTPTTPPPTTPLPGSSPPPASSALGPTATPALALSAPPPTSSPSAEIAPIGENGAAPSQNEARPFYTRWWFWTAVGVVVLGGIVVAVAAAKHDPACPGGYTCN
jgi:tetratricopeptide (TPR) repeat protein